MFLYQKLRKEITMQKKTYTVGYIFQNNKSVPFIKLAGKWLIKMGFETEDKFSLIEGKNMIILIKEDREKVEKEKEIKILEKRLKQLKSNK